jgi:D-sedoheptulose 7-phosphate isomerase
MKTIKFNKKKLNSTNFFKEYIAKLNKTQNLIDIRKIISIYKILEESILNNGQIFVAGNGGSASVANHFLCDFNKGIKNSSNNKLIPKVMSLSNSIELITAISNDISYEKIFSFQLENFAKSNDCIILFSCSGTSKNILEAIKMAKKNKVKIIFITGFLKKKLNIADIHLDLSCKNYGITEDIFSSIMHMVSQFIRLKYSQKKETL